MGTFEGFEPFIAIQFLNLFVPSHKRKGKKDDPSELALKIN